MSGEKETGNSEDWWPRLFKEIRDEEPLSSDDVVVAEIREAWEPGSYRHTYTALVHPSQLAAVLNSPGGIANGIRSNGPHPLQIGAYKPAFWVAAGAAVPGRLEPLVIGWCQYNQTVLVPDNGFLMTYGLVPRLVSIPGEPEECEIHWDDTARPVDDAVVVRPVSLFEHVRHSPAYVTIKLDYIKDYAALRGMALVQVFFAQRSGEITPEIKGRLGAERCWVQETPGRRLDLRRNTWRGGITAQVEGIRLLTAPPAMAPITSKYFDYGEMNWPGIEAPVSGESRWYELPGEVFVADKVLGEYEGDSRYTINPTTGSVSYGGQWAVSDCRRVGRDIIAVELRKLYEGAPPDVVRIWNRHAVCQPAAAVSFRENVATRTEFIFTSLCDLGASLSAAASVLLGEESEIRDIIGLEPNLVAEGDWWRLADVEKVTRHIPLDISEEQFLQRAADLHQLVVERLPERRLRRLLHSIGVDPDEIKSLKSIKLLQRICEIVQTADRVGLAIRADYAEVQRRRVESPPPTSTAILQVLDSLRQAKSHRGEAKSRERVDEALEFLGFARAGVKTGWGRVEDELYDKTHAALRDIAAVLQRIN